MNKKVSGSIFSGSKTIIPMADVQHIERHWYANDEIRDDTTLKGFLIITKHTTYSNDADFWNNNIYLSVEEGRKFLTAWTTYRHEVEGGEDTFKAPSDNTGDYTTNGHEVMKNGGEWLGAAREYIKCHANRGDDLIWGSNDMVIGLTISDVEEMVADAVAADRRQRTKR